MNIFVILVLLGFLVTPVFTLAICKSAGKADRYFEQMRASEPGWRAHKIPATVFKMESIDPSKEKTRPVLQRQPISVE